MATLYEVREDTEREVKVAEDKYLPQANSGSEPAPPPLNVLGPQHHLVQSVLEVPGEISIRASENSFPPKETEPWRSAKIHVERIALCFHFIF